jgi:hypothetical protein
LILSYFLANMADLQAPDAITVVITLQHPQPSFLGVLASAWRPKVISPTALAAYVQAHTNNLTVESVDYLAASAPAQMRVVLFVREEVAATAGTDYTLKLTHNDAAYGSAVTLTQLCSLVLADGSTVLVVRTDIEDVSGLTSGTEPGWRFQTSPTRSRTPWAPSPIGADHARNILSAADNG